eukprot:2183164-Amphidinium_carterae.2
MEEYNSKDLTAKQMMYYIGLYEVRARINRVDAVAAKKLIADNKLEAVLNKEYAKYRPQDPIHGVGDDEDFGNIFETAGTISILMRNLRIIRRILIALIGKLNDAEAEKFWKWEPGFGYQNNGKITAEAQTVTFRATVASSPMEMSTPRVYHEDSPSGGVKKVIGPRGRALSVGSMNKPKSPAPLRTSSRSRTSRQADGARRGESLGPMPRTSGLPTEFGPDSSGRSRSARRQRPDESNEVPEGGDDQQDHDFADDVDFTEEDAIPEEIPEHEEEGYHDNERGIHSYAERTDAMEERVMVDYDEIQSPEARPKLIVEPPPWWSTLLKYKPSGGITKEMCETRSTSNAMEAEDKEHRSRRQKRSTHRGDE